MKNIFEVGDIVEHKLTGEDMIVIKYYSHKLCHCRYGRALRKGEFMVNAFHPNEFNKKGKND